MEININIPRSVEAIKLKHYQAYYMMIQDFDLENLTKEDEEYISLKSVQIFCELEREILDKLPKKVIDFAVSQIFSLLGTKVDKINTFKMVGTDGVEVEFGLEPNLDEISYGAYQDAISYQDPKDWHKLLAVLYRPVIKKDRHQSYIIADYEGSGVFSEVMKDAPAIVYMGLMVFFYRLATKLSSLTLASISKEMAQENSQAEENNLGKSGVDIQRLSNLLTEISQKSTQ